MSGFPLVEDLQTLADYVHLSTELLYRLSKYNDKFYKIFKRPKENGGFRIIFCPSKEMKAVQAWILRNILDKIHVADSATGFRTGINVLENAKRHKENRYFLCLDIEDFFPSISYGKVYTVFRTIGYNPHVSHIFTSLCTCKGKLPQGGVSSPALSNIICIRLDHRISGYVGKRNVTYTRYADDMTFSSLNHKRLVGVKSRVTDILHSEAFKLNEAKTRLLGPRRQRKVTGIIISEGSLGVGRKRKRIIRATIHRLVKENLSSIEDERLCNHINGWLSYMKTVDNTGLNQIKKYTKMMFNQNGIDYHKSKLRI
ncbi:MAG: retron St85 family RNA-directed DNA polymerase [Candidatus Hodarchaeota archaeon]